MFQDLRYGVRMLLKHPGFTLIAILTLALGIGVNSALFTVYDAFLLKPLPFFKAELRSGRDDCKAGASPAAMPATSAWRLGATPGNVMRMVLKESLWLVLAGIGIGVSAALAVTRLISSRLFGVGSTDPLTIAVVSLLILVVAAAAALLPARKASSVDPMIALRHE